MENPQTGNEKVEMTFDQYTGTYEEALAEGIRVSGENRVYFAKGRVRWFAQCLAELNEAPRRGLDFGCGTGDTCPYLLQTLGLEQVIGVDVSTASVEYARSRHKVEGISFEPLEMFAPPEPVDVAYCNGVFHHIPPEERLAGAKRIRSLLRPGGVFSLWENNPWNPGTRFVMSRIPFDRDAVVLTAPETRRLLEEAGFEIVRTDFLFIFPRVLAWFRKIEPALARWPLGAQYQVLARRL